jgi:hypothetical protein
MVKNHVSNARPAESLGPDFRQVVDVLGHEPVVPRHYRLPAAIVSVHGRAFPAGAGLPVAGIGGFAGIVSAAPVPFMVIKTEPKKNHDLAREGCGFETRNTRITPQIGTEAPFLSHSPHQTPQIGGATLSSLHEERLYLAVCVPTAAERQRFLAIPDGVSDMRAETLANRLG